MEKVIKILKKYPAGRTSIIQILQDVQIEYNYLPKEIMVFLAEKLHIPLSKIYSIATFFNAFSLQPRGKHLVTVCMGTACHVRGAPIILSEFERQLAVKAGENTKDMKYTLDTVNCLGCCAIGPIVVHDGKYHGEFKIKNIPGLLKESD